MHFQVQAACQEAAREDHEPVQRVNNLRSATSAMGLHRCNAATRFTIYDRRTDSPVSWSKQFRLLSAGKDHWGN
jgi:hypothetical protein